MTSLFSSISGGGNPAYENLSNYFLGGATRARAAPSGVPSKRARDPRDASKPGQQPSNGRTPIPTSSQKPGNREGNQRIPYSRMMFTDMHDEARPREIKQGDVIFAHKTSMAMGGAPNRCNKCTSIPQINSMLSKLVPGVTTLDLSDPALAGRIKNARLGWLKGFKQDFENKAVGAKIRGSTEQLNVLNGVISNLAGAILMVENAPTITEFVPFVDCWAVKMVSDWTLDGVLISTDDDVELDDSNQPRLSRDDGVLMNVCVQGPTPMRNTAPQIENSVESHMWNPQYIDQGIHVMDKVFVGLFFDNNNDNSIVRFHYKLFSGRQALSMRANLNPLDKAGSFRHGPSEEEFRHCAGAWRVGSVMDNKLTTTVDRHIQLNVVVEWWNIMQLKAEYDDRIGYYQDLPLSGTSALAVVEALELVEEETVVVVGGDESDGDGEEDEDDILLRAARRKAATDEAKRRANQRSGTVRSAFGKHVNMIMKAT